MQLSQSVWKRLTAHQSYFSRILSIILIGFLLSGCGSAATVPPSNNGNSNQVEVSETSTSNNTVAEPIYLNNCGNSADTQQTSTHSQSVSIDAGGQIGVSAEVVQASVAAKYVTTSGVIKSQTVVASPGTNMKFVLLWTEQVNAGMVTVSNQSGQVTYHVTVPISVEQASAEDMGCQNGNTQATSEPSTPIPAPSPTTIIVVATESPLGNAIIGALNNDGTAAVDTSDIGLHPKRHLDAAGTYRATYEDHIWVTPETGTGIATFNGLEPGNYVVCFGQYGSWVKVGEITIEPYKTLSINFRWPPSYEIGSSCKLD
jgi:hypothetical protein